MTDDFSVLQPSYSPRRAVLSIDGARNARKPLLILVMAMLLHVQVAWAQNYTNMTMLPGNYSGSNITDVPSNFTTTAAASNTTSPPVSGIPSSQSASPTTLSPTFSPSAATPDPTNASAPPDPPSATLAPSMMPSMDPPNITNITNITATATVTTPATNITTAAPTVAPTNAPTNAATLAPTMMPTSATMAPTNATGPAPTETPTTAAPTHATVSGTSAPTASPTVGPTSASNGAASPAPTGAPTAAAASNAVLKSGSVNTLIMTLVGMNTAMTSTAESDWRIVTQKHVKSYFEMNPALGITQIQTTVSNIQQNIISVRRLRGEAKNNVRHLQTTGLQVNYTQQVSYRTVDPSRDTVDSVVTAPFATQHDRNDYLQSLKKSNPEFNNVQSVQAVKVASNNNTGGGGGGAPNKAVGSGSGSSGGLGNGAVAGIVVGCVVVVALVLGIGYYVSQRGDDGGYVSTGKSPPAHFDLDNGHDEVSTLAEPHTLGGQQVGNGMSGESLNYGDQSVATVDYDYSKAYGGGGDNSVSSAGGTFGSQTHTNAAGGATLGGTTGASGGPLDSSFGRESGSQFRGQNANVREELIDIYAPPGKLGVVIDTPDDGAPVVHAVKDSSVIADKLQVGDKLVAVDDEDVRSMTAIKVSKLISRKSANASRKLSIIRTVVVDE